MSDQTKDETASTRLSERVEQTKRLIEVAPYRASRSVLELARDFAFDWQLRIDAVSIRPPDALPYTVSDAERAAHESALAKYREKLNQLVDRIAADHNQPSQPALDAFRKRQAVFEATRGRTIRRETMVRTEWLTRELKEEQPFVLRPVSLDLKLGEVTGVVGGNGSGKTTLSPSVW